jgi:hypothetical protein
MYVSMTLIHFFQDTTACNRQSSKQKQSMADIASRSNKTPQKNPATAKKRTAAKAKVRAVAFFSVSCFVCLCYSPAGYFLLMQFNGQRRPQKIRNLRRRPRPL